MTGYTGHNTGELGAAMLDEKLEFEGLTGVGRVQLDLVPDQHIYTFIGANGVGKTKTLEALFQVLFFSCELIKDTILFKSDDLRFKKFQKTTQFTDAVRGIHRNYALSFSFKEAS
jgi:ABC-type branched-subunit amino acid transport system ATPase component